jgi:hypothetical protein
MSDLHELLTEYVDERTPEQAPPFTQVEGVVRRQRRRRNLATVAVVALIAGGVAVATVDLPRSSKDPATPPPSTSAPVLGALDDGPPPAKFKFGTTLLVLTGEIPVVGVTADPNNLSGVIVEAARDNSETCVPHTMVRILAQDDKTVRIAAYRYSVAPDQPEPQQCLKPGGKDLRIQLDLRWQLGNRKVLAGTTGNRSVLN